MVLPTAMVCGWFGGAYRHASCWWKFPADVTSTTPAPCAASIAWLIAGEGRPASDMHAIAVRAVPAAASCRCRSVTHERPLRRMRIAASARQSARA